MHRFVVVVLLAFLFVVVVLLLFWGEEGALTIWKFYRILVKTKQWASASWFWGLCKHWNPYQVPRTAKVIKHVKHRESARTRRIAPRNLIIIIIIIIIIHSFIHLERRGRRATIQAPRSRTCQCCTKADGWRSFCFSNVNKPGPSGRRHPAAPSALVHCRGSHYSWRLCKEHRAGPTVG